MQIHQIQPKNKQRQSRRVGRGGKRGTYSGRGMKGQKSRAGTRMQPRVREILKQYPKRRGYRRSPYAVQPAVLNVGAIEKHFESGEKVTPATLAERNLLGTIQKKPLPVKLLGNGTITKQVTVEGCMVSSAARKKIEEAGGSVV